MYILGAGLAGCMAAIRNNRSLVLEAGTGVVNHKALLRMRSEDVSNLTGIQFERAVIRKFIYDSDSDEFCKWATPRQINEYSLKVSGTVSIRSIVSAEDDVRFIPPHNFHQMLMDKISGRVQYEQRIEQITNDFVRSQNGFFDRKQMPIISTLPLDVMLRITGIDHKIDFSKHFNEIFVNELLIEDCNTHMTVYVLGSTSIYRASLIGQYLNIESMLPIDDNDIEMVKSALGIETVGHESVSVNHRQVLGKIIDVNENERKRVIRKLTTDFNIYSLGRFACWRNILTDDLINDMNQIENLMYKSEYERALS